MSPRAQRLLTPLLAATLLLAAACDDAAPASPQAQTTPDAGDAADAAPANNSAEDTGNNTTEDTNTENNSPSPEDSGADAPEEDAPGEEDASAPPDSGEGVDGGLEVPCPLGEARAADRERVVLVSHPFSATIGVDGTDVRVMRLTTAGELIDTGRRVDVGFVVARMEFVPSGEVALVLGERGELAALRVRGEDDVEVINQITLPSAGFGDLRVRTDGRLAWVAGSNSTPDGGITTVGLGCREADLGRVEADLFTPLLLAQSVAPLGDGSRMAVLGGQALFDPVNDVRDVRLFEVGGDGGLQQTGAFDLYGDFVTASRIAASPDGEVVLIPNSSPFSAEGGQLAVVEVQGESLVEIQRIEGLADVSEVIFAPDGQTALATQVEPGRVRVLVRGDDNRFNLLEMSFRAGLGEQLAQVERGSLAGLVLVPAIDPAEGSNVTLLRIIAKGQVEALGRVLLGEGIEEIPDAIAVQP